MGVLIRWSGVGVRPVSLAGDVHFGPGCAVRAGWCQVFAWLGGPQTRVNSSVQAVSQGQVVGRCRVSRRAEDAIHAGTVMRVRRMVAVVALARGDPMILATARSSHAAFATKRLEGTWARAEFLRSAWICSMIAW